MKPGKKEFYAHPFSRLWRDEKRWHPLDKGNLNAVSCKTETSPDSSYG
jgi:hypothetical protein